MASPTRKILISAGTVAALLLAAVLLVPLLFSGRIIERAKTEANAKLKARVNWQSAGLSLFGDFPNLTLRLDGLTAVGSGPFAADTLAAVAQLRVSLDLGSAVVAHTKPAHRNIDQRADRRNVSDGRESHLRNDHVAHQATAGPPRHPPAQPAHPAPTWHR